MTWQYNPERGDLIAESIRSTHGPLLANAPAMLDLLKKLYARIESGYLVRNTLEDSGPTFHMDALEFVLELKKTQELIERIEKKIMTGTELIAAERQRQIEVEGWSPEHDDEHDAGQLVDAARAYTWAALCEVKFGANSQDLKLLPNDWPKEWDKGRWKPSDDPIRNLTKAGALIAAEIDRLQRIKDKDQRALETKQRNVGGVK